MNKYLLQILHEVNTIIIPGLGALTVTDKTTGEIMFMSYLKHDDGNLAKYISEKDSLSENDAKNMIAKYVREIQVKLDKGESYDMYQFGSFYKKDGEIEFTWWNAQDSTTHNTAQVEDAVQEISNPVVEVKEAKVEEEKPEIKPEEKVEKEVVKPVSETISTPKPVAEKPKEEVKIEKKLDTTNISPSENVYIPENEVQEITEKQKTKTPEVKAKEVKKIKEPKIKKERKKRSTAFWILTILVAFIVLSGVTTAIFFKEIEAKFSGKEVALNKLSPGTSTDENLEEIEKQVALEGENNEAENEVEEPVTETPNQEVEIPVKKTESVANGQLPYNVIAGSFSVETNADNFAKKLKAEGNDSKVLGMFDNIFLVSHSSYASQEEANSARSKAGPNAWVFKYPK